MHWIDAGLAALLLLTAWRGWRVGFLGQIGALIGRGAGLIGGLFFGPRWTAHVVGPSWRWPALLGVILVASVLGSLAGRALGRGLAKVSPLPGGPVLDQLLGATAALSATLAVLWLAAIVVTTFASGTLAAQVHNSVILQTLLRDLPAAPASWVHHLRAVTAIAGFGP